MLRIVLCGHAGEHDELLQHGWTARKWTARKGYAAAYEVTSGSPTDARDLAQRMRNVLTAVAMLNCSDPISDEAAPTEEAFDIF